MPELKFGVTEVAMVRHAAVPMLAARLHIANTRLSEPVHSMSLNCQVSIEPLRRGYSASEEAKLLDLFGERERWGRTMKPLLWTIATIGVAGFVDQTDIDVPLPCTLDFDVAATKYFYGLDQGSVRASMVFSGTVFYAGRSGMLQVMQIPWQSEARFELAVEMWREAIDAHYPGFQWLRLPRETFERLYRYKVEKQIPMWDGLMEHLLDRAEHAAASAGEEPEPDEDADLAGVQR